MKAVEPGSYLQGLKKRGENKRINSDYQLAGLEVATMLRDLEHKSLYIKLAKQHGPDAIFALARDVLDRRNVKNPGAYFMRLIGNLKKPTAREQYDREQKNK